MSLNPGFIKFIAWTRDFNPRTQQNTSAQVWVIFFGVPQEYWRPRIPFAIARSVGSPICIDPAATNSKFERTFGQYVRILVDMDVSQALRYKVLVERKGYTFFVEVDYENLPHFCSHCKKVGHYLEICKFAKKNEGDVIEKEAVQKKHPAKNIKKTLQTQKYRRKEQGNHQDNSVNQDEEVIRQQASENDANIKGKGPIDNNLEGTSKIPVLNQVVPMNEVDDQADATTSDGSEFVENTQVNDGGTESESEEEVNIESPDDKTQRNMEFLKESWANMEESEQDEALLLAELEKHDEQEKTEETEKVSISAESI